MVLAGLVVVVVSIAWALLARALAPMGNTDLTHFDTIVVLGARVDGDGNPSPALLARITEGVREYNRGMAPRLIVSGGLDRGQYIQAEVMARVAESQGVPRQAVVLEPKADDTIQNACYSARLMKENGWHSAEIVSSASHLPRAGLIFSRLPIQWRAHAAPPLEPVAAATPRLSAAWEDLKTIRYLLYADWAERCSP